MNRLSDDGDSLFSHLIELRTRLMRGVLALVGVFAVLVPFANRLYQLLADPLLAKLPAGGQLVAIDVASPFFAPIKLAFFVALIVSMPVLLYQAWAFVAPGLYKHERRLAKPLLVSAVLLFYLGCAFAYFIMLPAVFAFLTATTPSGVAMMTDISRYLDFVLIIFLAAGLSFEMPIAVIVLVALGVVQPAQLRASRGYVIVGIFIVAAIITPPDALSQLMLGIPMLLLYEVGVIAAGIIARRKPASDPAAE
ncbi:MAG: twin-arginine translocase subunit TatC [Gammaproteobacteria bacterium HGW-Gammaproteobacteria-2]|jgi:sec-independent protein translocase protein TatC|nr:MAG: twin-arginine translocase subunit TatC [Gammaproteobacteria bacterium HGW-Gammaproteobacteria-2]